MLSGQEGREFAEIAEQIGADDPRFAVSMRRLQSRRAGRGHDVVIVVSAATAVLCLLLSLGPAAFACEDTEYAWSWQRGLEAGRGTTF